MYADVMWYKYQYALTVPPPPPHTHTQSGCTADYDTPTPTTGEERKLSKSTMDRVIRGDDTERDWAPQRTAGQWVSPIISVVVRVITFHKSKTDSKGF